MLVAERDLLRGRVLPPDAALRDLRHAGGQPGGPRQAGPVPWLKLTILLHNVGSIALAGGLLIPGLVG